LATLEKDGAAVTFLGVGAVFLLLTSFNRFKEIEVFGMKARMRKLKKTIQQAEVTLEQLRALAELACEGIVPTAKADGHFAGFDVRVQRVIQYRKILKGLGSDEARVKEILAPLVGRIFEEAVRILMRPMSEMISSLTTQNMQKRFDTQNNGGNVLGIAEEGQRLDEQLQRIGMVLAEDAVPDVRLDRFRKIKYEQFPGSPFTTEQQRKIDLWAPRCAELLESCDIKDIEVWLELGREGRKNIRVEGDTVVIF
jgi:hypothetical protein